MGRYFLYRMHPLSLAELSHTSMQSCEAEIRKPTLKTILLQPLFYDAVGDQGAHLPTPFYII